MVTKLKIECTSGKRQKILTPLLLHAAVLYRCWSSGSPSRARAAPLRPACRLPLSPTAPLSQHTTFTGPRCRTQPPRPWPWLNQTPMIFMRSPGLSMRVGVSTRAVCGCSVVTNTHTERKMDSSLEGGVVEIHHTNTHTNSLLFTSFSRFQSNVKIRCCPNTSALRDRQISSASAATNSSHYLI